ncbi:MAG TPA: RNA methyltransferase [Clostridiales bacterium]|jgi:TrmH family RNA methyltransferase|nr:RNA methyltransferase [Clostridiales bacterium]
MSRSPSEPITITSRRNPTIIKICGLRDKKNREAERLFRFDGIKLYCEAVFSGLELVYVLLCNPNSGSVISRIKSCGAPDPNETGATVISLPARLFESVSEEKSPEGIISVAKYIDKFHKIATIDNNSDAGLSRLEGKIIMLKDIQDPGNLGTMLRSAAALGFERVILAGACADIYNPKTLRAAMGATFRLGTLALRGSGGAEVIRTLQASGRRVFAATPAEGAINLCDLELRASDCFIIGNEGHGLDAGLVRICDASVKIPMSPGSESMNAASAAAIFMWEISNSK